MFDFLKKLFGTKSEKDIKNLESKVQEINSIYNSLNSVSNDELRAKSAALKAKLQESIKDKTEKIASLKSQIANEPTMDVNTKEDFYKEIDELEKDITAELEKSLTEILPEAFAILKETARQCDKNR